MSQQDLFDFSNRTHSTTYSAQTAETPAKTAFSFLEQTRISLRLDHLLTLSIALMVSGVLIYASGMERGKQAAWTPRSEMTSAMTAKENQSGETAPVEIKADAVESAFKSAQGEIRSSTSFSSSSSSFSQTETRISTQRTFSTPDGSYTIQLATYKTESLAQKKMEALSSQGLEAFLIPSGSYYQVCVNGFSKKMDAAQSLSRLKSKGIAPRDAYVRLIPA